MVQIKRAISTWLHKFADTAEKALTVELVRQGLVTEVERSRFVNFLLGNVEDMTDKKRLFIWDSVYDNPSEQPEVSKPISTCRYTDARLQGMFQGRLVACTFLEHVQVINMLDVSERVQGRPVGALILSVQAVSTCIIYVDVLTLRS